MIRVLHALNELQPSGAERMLASSAGMWEQHGVEIVILGAGTRHPYAEDLRRLGYRVILCPSTRTRQGLAEFATAVRALRPDIVHLHAESMFAPMALAARSCGSVKSVLRSIHSIVGVGSKPGFRRKRRRRLMVARAAGMRAFACSAEVAQHEMNAFGLRTQVVENWVDTGGFSRSSDGARDPVRAELGIDADTTVVTVVGSCGGPKNHELLLKAVLGMSGGLMVLHVGGHASSSDHERQLIAELEWRGAIRLLGLRDDVPRIMAASDAVAVPSHHEGFSVVAAESLCAGVPLLAARSPGLAWVEEFATPQCLLLEAEVWSERLEALAAGDRPRREALDSDRESALRRFAPARGVAQWAEIYRRLVPAMATQPSVGRGSVAAP